MDGENKKVSDILKNVIDKISKNEEVRIDIPEEEKKAQVENMINNHNGFVNIFYNILFIIGIIVPLIMTIGLFFITSLDIYLNTINFVNLFDILIRFGKAFRNMLLFSIILDISVILFLVIIGLIYRTISTIIYWINTKKKIKEEIEK